MNAADQRRLTSAGVLTAAAVAVVVMALWGVNAVSAPFGDGSPTNDSGPNCPPEDQIVTEFVVRNEVTVSVYNTGKRKGRASATLTLLEDAGFRPGAIGNGEEGDRVRRAVVRTTREDNAAARLVAKALGPDVQVEVVEDDYGPGVDVFIGDRFNKLNRKAPRRERLTEPITSCG